ANYPGKAQPAGTFTPTGSMITPRSGHTATLLFNGKVLISGGGAATEDPGLPLVGGDGLYNSSTGTFEPSGGISEGHTVPLLPDGRVLSTGLDLRATVFDSS